MAPNLLSCLTLIQISLYIMAPGKQKQFSDQPRTSHHQYGRPKNRKKLDCNRRMVKPIQQGLNISSNNQIQPNGLSFIQVTPHVHFWILGACGIFSSEAMVLILNIFIVLALKYFKLGARRYLRIKASRNLAMIAIWFYIQQKKLYNTILFQFFENF
ncbi:hypothetical protein BpHYR1_020687 [Brachionus plicatilis]|uniref:Transmembrane protein n=1 Tax=Brachionus plicatilis TaxID=10195 RepID=A0A3M7T5B4_BRAPC|nr:hypothetical protein BpHYR1_020687 [Brachionus plicatilis]